jgi:hypothetical protein
MHKATEELHNDKNKYIKATGVLKRVKIAIRRCRTDFSRYYCYTDMRTLYVTSASKVLVNVFYINIRVNLH